MNNHQPNSKEALRTKCTLLEGKNLSLQIELEIAYNKIAELEKAHAHFIELVSSPRGYKQWLRNTLINELQVIKVA